MAHNYNIAIVGPKEAIIGFKAVGLTPFFCNETQAGIELLQKIKKETNDPSHSEKYAIVFITEELAQSIPTDDWAKLTSEALPAIISLPSHQGSTGFGLERLNRIVERAVGSNILG